MKANKLFVSYYCNMIPLNEWFNFGTLFNYFSWQFNKVSPRNNESNFLKYIHF